MNLRKLGRIATSGIRVLPDFIIIGAQKCGTTSLYHYILQHPLVIPAFKKEVHFFDLNFSNGPAWYRAHFPSVTSKLSRFWDGGRRISGEASPYYIFHPRAPIRVRATIPSAKLIALLRNPVDRAYSHYHHVVRHGKEDLSFEEALEKEKDRLRGEQEKLLEDERYYSAAHQVYSYLSRGIYIDQLKRWRSLFPTDQLLIIRSEDFFAEPAAIVGLVFQFLELPARQVRDSDNNDSGEGNYQRMSRETRKRLLRYFEPHNERLYSYLGKDFDWDK